MPKVYIEMQDLIYKTILELCTNAKARIGQAEFQVIYGQLEATFRGIKLEQLGYLTEAVCSICSELAPQEMAQGVASTSRIPVSILFSIDIS